MKVPVVSIIVPLYNGVELTRQCLDSLSANVNPELYELIIVDNASNDETQRLLDSLHASVCIIRNATNLGFARACNQGAWAASTPYLLFLNNDTVVTPGWLEALCEACQADVGIVGCRMLYPDGSIQHAGIELVNGIPDHPYRHQPADSPVANMRRDLDMVTGACLLIRRDLFLQLGGFDEVYRNGVEDVDLCLRVREAGYRVVYEPRAMIYHHEGQSSGRFDHVDHNLRFFIERWKGRFDAQGRFIAADPPHIMTSGKSHINEQRRHIIWQGSQFVCHSLALVNRELCLRLIRNGHDLSIIPFGPDDFAPEPGSPLATLQQQVNRPLSGPADVVVRHQWPPDFNPPPSGHWVMIQPWEFGSLPKQWIKPMNEELDEMWVPSGYVRDCYIKSGVSREKVFVVPNGIDAELYSPAGTAYPVPSGKSFRFLFVGGTIHRKGIDLLLAAYRHAFSAQDDVCLVIKDMGGASFYQGQTAQEMIRRFSADPAAPEIVYIDQNLPPEGMAALYRSCHCLAHPYRGEGFGLPIAEAMACGVPVIVTGHGAALDFCPPGIAWLIPAREVPLGACRIGDIETVDVPWLAEPDVDALRGLIRYAFDHPDEAGQRGTAACEHIRRRFTWDHAARCVEARLQELRGKPVVRFSREKALPDSDVAKGAVAVDESKRHEMVSRIMTQARLLQMRGDVDGAVALLLNQGIGTAPASPAPYLALAETLMAARRFEDALQVLPEMPANTDSALVCEIEALCHCAVGNDEAARKAALRSGNAPRAMVVLGTLAARQGDMTGAESWFRRAIDTDPSCGSGWLSLAMLLWGQGRLEGAWGAVQRAVPADPLNGEAVRILRDMAGRAGQQPEALRIISGAVHARPDCLLLALNHAEMLAECGREAEALDACEAFLARFGVDDGLLRLSLDLRQRVGLYQRIGDVASGESVSLCMIVKNEELNLPTCLASLKPIVHEMVIVDTGSIDRTIDIATVFGAKIATFAWNGNFSDARNASLDKARCDWVLVMDADEVIAPQDYAVFRRAVNGSTGKKVCWNILTRNYTSLHPAGWVANDGIYPLEERAEGWHPSLKLRLFPNDSQIRFTGEIHEMIDEKALEAGFQVKDASFVVHHYGTLADSANKDNAKKRIYFELGRQKLAEHPDDPQALGELAVQAAGLELYDEAVSLWDRFLLISPDAVVALFNKGYCLMGMKRYAEARDVSRRALLIDPFHKEAAYNYGTCELYVGDAREAIARLEPVLGQHPAYPPLLAILTALHLSLNHIEQAGSHIDALKAINYSVHGYLESRSAVLRELGHGARADGIMEGLQKLQLVRQPSGVS